jgi:hypothetical protein
MRALALARLDEKQEVLKPLDVDDSPDAVWVVLNFFEHVSLLANKGYLDDEMVWSEFSYWMFNVYADARPLIGDDQKDNPAAFDDLPLLMERLRKIESKEGRGAQDHPSPAAILDFYQGEISGPPTAQPHGKKKPIRPR